MAEQTDKSAIHARTAVLIEQVFTPGALHAELAISGLKSAIRFEIQAPMR